MLCICFQLNLIDLPKYSIRFLCKRKVNMIVTLWMLQPGPTLLSCYIVMVVQIFFYINVINQFESWSLILFLRDFVTNVIIDFGHVHAFSVTLNKINAKIYKFAPSNLPPTSSTLRYARSYRCKFQILTFKK